MASVNRIVAVDIGSHSIKLGEFFMPKEGYLTLSRFASAPLGLDPNKEEDWLPILTKALKQLILSSGIKSHTKVVFSVGAHAVFMRSLKLPAVDALQVEQMVTFEAQQIVPFPLDQVVWDFQISPGSKGSVEKEAVIVAMKSDLLEVEVKAIQAAGLEPTMIDVGPLALYNAYRYNYPTRETCSLLIDFGARSMNLLFIENDRYYARNLPLAGNTISQTISNEFQEPFHIAEQLKLDRGGVNLGGDYVQPSDRDTARLWKIVRNVMNRIHAEVNRSIIFYRNQQGGSNPVEILITGGTSKLPYIEAYLSDRFGIPIYKFNPFQNVNFVPGLDLKLLSTIGPTFGEVVGMALRAAGPCPLEVSLIPPSISKKMGDSQQKPLTIMALVLWLLLFIILIGNGYWELRETEKQTEKIGIQVRDIDQLVSQQKPLEKENSELEGRYKLAEKIFSQRDTWPRLLQDINSKVPPTLWITSLEPMYNGESLDKEPKASSSLTRKVGSPSTIPSPVSSPPEGFVGAPEINQIFIKGLFENKEQGSQIVNDFVKALSELDLFDIDVLSAESHGPADTLALPYTLRLKLKKPISLYP